MNTVEVTCEAPEGFACTVPVPICSQYPLVDGFRCICDMDAAGDPLCWRDAFCGDLTECTSNDDCDPNEKCASTCCGVGHCLEDCAMTGSPLRRHYRKMEERIIYSGETTAMGERRQEEFDAKTIQEQRAKK